MTANATKAHAYADLFPMMSALELEALAEDIAANGLRQPVVRYQGQVLDGRNRLQACARAGVEPAFTDYDGDDAGALALVISLNVQRRDLTAAQRALVAARSLGPFEEAALKRQQTGMSADGEAGGRGRKKEKPPGKSSEAFLSREQCGKMFKVSDKSVQQAKALLAEAPDLAAQVETCSCSLADAYAQLQTRRQEAKRKEKDAARVAEYKDAVSSGEMSLDEALRQAIEQERQAREDQAAEADARRTWLKGFAEHLDWFERFLHERSDEHLAWYTLPDSPGLFAHGITPGRINAVIQHLERAIVHTFGGPHHGPTQGRARPRPATS